MDTLHDRLVPRRSSRRGRSRDEYGKCLARGPRSDPGRHSTSRRDGYHYYATDVGASGGGAFPFPADDDVYNDNYSASWNLDYVYYIAWANQHSGTPCGSKTWTGGGDTTNHNDLGDGSHSRDYRSHHSATSTTDDDDDNSGCYHDYATGDYDHNV